MGKKLSIAVIVMMIVIMFFGIAGYSGNDYARITDMDYKAILVDEPDSKGKIVVTERITFDVHAASRDNGFWELWRDLCEDYVDGVKVHYNVNSVKQILPDGSEIIWPESPKLYWEDYDYENSNPILGPGKWYHSPGPYDEEGRRYEAIFFYIDNVYREKMVFEIEYEMYNAALRYGDCSDLYVSLYSGETTKYLQSLNAEFLIPNKDMPKAGNYKATTYGTNKGSFPIEESDTKNPGYYTFSFNLTEEDLEFKPHNEYIEFDLVSYGDDKHIFTDYASINDYYNDAVLDEVWAEQEFYQNLPQIIMIVKMSILFVCVIISIIIIIKNRKKIIEWKEKFPFYSSDLHCDTFRDIPNDLDPNFAAELVFCKDKKKKDEAGIYSAILLNLARKGYVRLIENASDEVTIIIKELETSNLPFESTEQTTIFVDKDGDMITDEIELSQSIEDKPVESREPLTITERFYLSLIERHAVNNVITMDKLQSCISTDYDYTNRFVRNMKKSIIDIGVGKKYFQKANYLEPKQKLLSSSKKLILFGFIFLILVNFVASKTPIDYAFGGFSILGITCAAMGFYLKSNAHKYVLLTEFGEQEYNKWRGLYNFLKSDTLINERTIIELPLWEKYLVYATAFGISEKVIEAIKLRCPENVVKTNSIVHNNYCRSGRIRSYGRSFHSSVHHGSSFSSSSSGGFGYGGGGRGGGGGGGGH